MSTQSAVRRAPVSSSDPKQVAERRRSISVGPAASLALIAFLAVLPVLVVDPAQQFLMAYMAIVCILALSLHLLMGIAGAFSLGQAALFGSGAYASVVFMDKLALDGLIALPLVAVLGAVLGAVMALVTLRATDLYLALTTLAIAYVLENIVRNADSLGGAYGLSGFTLEIAGQSLDDPRKLYWAGIVIAVMLALMIASMRRSRLGRALMAARESPIAASSIGVDTKAHRVFAFAFAGAFSAVAGGLYVAYSLVVDPSVFGLDLTLLVLTVVIVGGVRSMPGVLVAAIVLTYFRTSAETIGLASYVLLIYGLLILLTLLFLPEGLGGLFTRLRRRTAVSSSHLKEGVAGE